MNVSALLRLPVARFLSRFCPPRNEGARAATLALLAVLAAVPLSMPRPHTSVGLRA